MQDSVVEDGQFFEDSPDVDTQQPSSNGRAVAELEAEIRDLKSRLGRQAQVSGEEKRAIEAAYKEWQANYQAYYEGEIGKRDDIIANLEQELITKLDSDGARIVIESRDAREQASRQQRAQQEEAARRAAQELEDTKADVLATYPSITAEDLAGVRNPRSLWAVAARLDRERSVPQQQVAPPPAQAPRREPDTESRVPTPTSSAPRPQATRQTNSTESRIQELEEQRATYLKKGRLAEAMGVSREITRLRAE